MEHACSHDNVLIILIIISRRRLTTLNKWFKNNGYNVTEIWASIEVSYQTYFKTRSVQYATP